MIHRPLPDLECVPALGLSVLRLNTPVTGVVHLSSFHRCPGKLYLVIATS